MKIKTSELEAAALDWAVCVAAGWEPTVRSKVECQNEQTTPVFLGDNEQRPSTNWAQGGPIIEREGIDIWCSLLGQPDHTDPAWRVSDWKATCVFKRPVKTYGPTPLIAAMRCYVAFKLGDEVEIPDELL